MSGKHPCIFCLLTFSAFDTISRSCIWDTRHKRGIAPKSINLIRAQYDPGVRQGCLMALIIFFITLNEVLRAAVEPFRYPRYLWPPRGSRLCRWYLLAIFKSIGHSMQTQQFCWRVSESWSETDLSNKDTTQIVSRRLKMKLWKIAHLQLSV